MARIVVALSGGVDSAVAAALLAEAGHDLLGVTLRLWPQSRCCDERDIEDAADLCAQLGIPYQVLDYRQRFREAIVEPFVADYLAGRTPNPCARCNQLLKFDALWQEAAALGADFLATGHYVRLRQQGEDWQLWRALDHRKDQSYFLFALPAQLLPRLRFPLGEWRKEEVRAWAQQRGLKIAGKGDSQDLCFIPGGDTGAFVKAHAPVAVEAGEIVDDTGAVLGRHEGLVHYTVGQRRGLGGGAAEPRYVVALDSAHNRLRVGPEAALYRNETALRDCNWLTSQRAGPDTPVAVKLRYAAAPVAATLQPLEGAAAKLRFAAPQRAVTPGQAAVCYDGERLLGGGWIVDG
ncbi:MAG: tRNA 2-thiouridine(34) synthase MnmA [Acidithiobacillus sp.]